MVGKETLPRPVLKYIAGLRPEDQEPITATVEQVHQALLAGEPIGQIVADLAAHPVPTPEAELVMLEALARLAHPQIPAILQARYAGAIDKPQRKALKKALHYLKAQGVAVPPDLLKDDASPMVRPVSGLAPVKTYMSRIEGNGSRMVIVHLSGQRQSFNLFLALCNDVEGLKDAYAVLLTNKETKTYLADTRREMPGELVDIPPNYALYVIDDAYQVNPDPASEAVKTYLRVRPRLQDVLGTEPAPAIQTLLPPLDAPEQYLEQSRELVFQEEFGNWFVSPEKLAPWLEKIQEIEKSPLVLSPEQQLARMEQAVAEALQEVFPPAQRPIISRRLLEMAYYLDHTGKPYLARQAQAAGLDLLRPRSALERENQFLLGLTTATLREMYDLAKDESKPPDQPSQGKIITHF